MLIAVLPACGRIGFGVSEMDGNNDGTGAEIAVGCGSSESAGPFHTDFALGLPAWATPYNQPSAQVMFATGVMTVIPGDAPAPAYAGLSSPNGDFQSRRVFIEVPTMVDTTTAAVVGIGIEQGNGTPYAAVYQESGMLFAEIDVSGTFDTSMVPYDPVAHRWWQLREQAGTMFFEASADGIAWTTIAQKPTPAFVSNAYLDLFGGVDTVQTASLGTATFSNVFDCMP